MAEPTIRTLLVQVITQAFTPVESAGPIEPGAVVMLRSGGPLMTVIGGGLQKISRVEVGWFNDGEYRTAEVSEDALVTLKPIDPTAANSAIAEVAA